MLTFIFGFVTALVVVQLYPPVAQIGAFIVRQVKRHF